VGERVFKYHGLGNDFVVLDRRGSGVDLTPSQATAMCDRHRGVGADGALSLLPARGALARMVVHNADGSIAQMCGNGLRCAVKYLIESAIPRPEEVEVDTDDGRKHCLVRYAPDGTVAEVEASMGAPAARFVNGVIEGTQLRGTSVSMGNPHLVLFDRPLSDAATLGPVLEILPIFEERTNVEVVEWVSSKALSLAVWERGVGLTLACGTGACAAAAAAVLENRQQPGQWIDAHLPGGTLRLFVEPDLGDIRMRGGATFVFSCELP
jgi:diaminopimelate epimerase